MLMSILGLLLALQADLFLCPKYFVWLIPLLCFVITASFSNRCLEMSAAMATNATQVHAALQEAGNEEETIKLLKHVGLVSNPNWLSLQTQNLLYWHTRA